MRPRGIHSPSLLNELRYRVANHNNPSGLINDPDSKPDTDGLSPQWEHTPAPDKIKIVEKLVSADHSLQAAWAFLRAAVDTTNPAIAAACHHLATGLHDISNVTRSMAKTKFFNYEHGVGRVTATNFFDVVELTEHILLHLSISDVLAMTQVNTRVFSIIEGSDKLQRHLHLRPDDSAVLRSLDFHPRLLQDNHDAYALFPYIQPHRVPRTGDLPNLDISINEQDHGGCVRRRGPPKIKIKIEFPSRVYANPAAPFGRRVRKMLVCQPPITEMDVSVKCCGASSAFGYGYAGSEFDGEMEGVYGRQNDGTRFAKVRNEDGITLKDLYNTCWDIAEQHHLCPQAGVYYMDEDGLVWPTFRFEGTVPEGFQIPDRDEFRMRDELFHQRKAGLKRNKEAYQMEGLLQEYAVAKALGKSDPRELALSSFAAKKVADSSIAWRDGLAIPTLAEFKANAAFWESKRDEDFRAMKEHGSNLLA